jgi:hypothetical protein
MLVERRSDTVLGSFVCKIVILAVLIYPKLLKEAMYGATVGEIMVFQIHRRRLKSRRIKCGCHLKHISKTIWRIICHRDHTMLSHKISINRSRLGAKKTKPSSGNKQISRARRFSVRAEAIKMPSTVSKMSSLSIHGAKPCACNKLSITRQQKRNSCLLSLSRTHYLFYSPVAPK